MVLSVPWCVKDLVLDRLCLPAAACPAPGGTGHYTGQGPCQGYSARCPGSLFATFSSLIAQLRALPTSHLLSPVLEPALVFLAGPALKAWACWRRDSAVRFFRGNELSPRPQAGLVVLQEQWVSILQDGTRGRHPEGRAGIPTSGTHLPKGDLVSWSFSRAHELGLPRLGQSPLFGSYSLRGPWLGAMLGAGGVMHGPCLAAPNQRGSS